MLLSKTILIIVYNLILVKISNQAIIHSFFRLETLKRLIQVYNWKVNFYRQTYIEEPHQPISFEQGQYLS